MSGVFPALYRKRLLQHPIDRLWPTHCPDYNTRRQCQADHRSRQQPHNHLHGTELRLSRPGPQNYCLRHHIVMHCMLPNLVDRHLRKVSSTRADQAYHFVAFLQIQPQTAFLVAERWLAAWVVSGLPRLTGQRLNRA